MSLENLRSVFKDYCTATAAEGDSLYSDPLDFGHKILKGFSFKLWHMDVLFYFLIWWNTRVQDQEI